MYRHGDVLLKPVLKIPATARLCKDRVIALGLSTGHAHRFKESDVKVYVLLDGSKFVRQPLTRAHLVHDEHDTLIIPRGVYQVIIQQEFDLIEGIRTTYLMLYLKLIQVIL